MKGMQADYTKKTQELAAQRKELQRERESLSKVKFEVPEVGDYDPFDESSVQKRIEAEVAKKLQLLLEPMQQEAELLRAESDYQAFLTENPDFKTDKALRSEVQALLESNPQLDLETAYLAVQGKRARSGKGAPDPKAAARKAAAKEAAAVVAPPRRGAPQAKPDAKSIRSMSTADILELAKSMHRAG
jgi:predicted ATP-grasp superfamily ATP-dependent carboligase